MRTLALAVILAACSDPASGPGGSSRTVRMQFQLPRAMQLDVLLVVDNSPAMVGRRDQLLASTDALVAVLASAYGGLPDLHLGVVTTDVGTVGSNGTTGASIGVIGQGGCAATGDDGAMSVRGAAVTGAFLSDVRQPDGSRTRNYTGELATVVRQLADVGTGGCAFARPLEAARRALGPSAANAGFLRDDALLFVVHLTADDDCSFADAAYLAGATPSDTSRCRASQVGLVESSSFAASVMAVKADPSDVFVASVVGATVRPRLHDLGLMFPNRNSEADLDAIDAQAVYAPILSLYKMVLGIPCWELPLLDVDPATPGLQPACAAELHTDATDLALPRCEPGATAPCYTIADEPQSCLSSGLTTRVEHVEAYDGGSVTIECLVED